MGILSWVLCCSTFPMIGHSVSDYKISYIAAHLNHFIEEILIGFQELIGEHSGENMAALVYATVVALGLEGQVCVKLIASISYPLRYLQIMSIVSDNAANSNTMRTLLEEQFHEDGIEFNNLHAWGHCLPHTVHLSGDACKFLISQSLESSRTF